ncbi:MAG: hypothetical protein ABIJ56_13205 [Pseudomonadota bacterium]
MPGAARCRALAACAVALSIAVGPGAWARDAEDPTVAAEEDGTQGTGEDGDRPAGANCAGKPEARWVYNQLLVLRYNSLGADYRGRVGVCVPFLTDRGKFFDLSNFELGIAHELSPAFGHLGGYVGFAPLSILSFRVQATGLLYWELPLDRSAYFPVDGYGANIGSDHYPHEQGQTEGGWNVSFAVNFQVKLPIGPVALIALDSFAYEIWSMDDSDRHYINLRHDIVMAGYDHVISNEAMLMLEVPLPRNMAIRFGAYDSLRWVADAVHQNHSIGPLAMLTWPELPRGVRGLTIFLRVGWYADRSPADSGPTVIYIGLLSTYDLGSALSRSAGWIFEKHGKKHIYIRPAVPYMPVEKIPVIS